jgi:hypothetical protein
MGGPPGVLGTGVGSLFCLRAHGILVTSISERISPASWSASFSQSHIIGPLFCKVYAQIVFLSASLVGQS